MSIRNLTNFKEIYTPVWYAVRSDYISKVIDLEFERWKRRDRKLNDVEGVYRRDYVQVYKGHLSIEN